MHGGGERKDGAEVHRRPERHTARSHTREYLRREHGLRLRELIESFHDPLERRDFFARNKDIKGIGYKESSHFLRNIGYGGYAILDKHILNTLSELGVIASPKPPGTRDRYIAVEDASPKPPGTRDRYIAVEDSLRHFAGEIGIPMDELDLLLWSEKTGEVLK